MKDKAWIPPTALALVGALLLPLVWVSPPFRYVAAGLAAVGIGAFAVWFWGRLRRRDRYSLEALREVHERETVKSLLDEEEPVGAEVDACVCPHCGARYPAAIGACPECRCNGGS